MRIVIFSGTSELAKACASTWLAKSGVELILVGRSSSRLSAVAADFRLRFPEAQVKFKICDLLSEIEIQNACAKIFEKQVDLVLVAQGSLTSQPRASTDISYLRSEIELNASSVAICSQIASNFLQDQNAGQLAVIGSVAGDRGRAYNYAYGASKAFLECFVEGLQQKFGNTPVGVSLIKPGPTASPMTATHKGRMAKPTIVAEAIVKGLALRKRVIYAPGIWALIMLVIRNIPFFIFKRLNF